MDSVDELVKAVGDAVFDETGDSGGQVVAERAVRDGLRNRRLIPISEHQYQVLQYVTNNDIEAKEKRVIDEICAAYEQAHLAGQYPN